MIAEITLSAPILLIAVPQLRDPHFQTSVILVVEHNEEGSMGLILNRPSPLPIGAFCASQRMIFQGDITTLVHNGGPLQTDRAFILHASSHQGPETQQVTDEIRLSYSMEALRLLASDPPEQMRVFLGYAGWGPGQLAKEICSGGWLLGDVNSELIFAPSRQPIWEQALAKAGIEAYRLSCSYARH